MESNEVQVGSHKRKRRILGIMIGMFSIGLSWVLFSLWEQNRFFAVLFSTCLLLLGLNLMVDPMEDFLKKYLITRKLYLTLKAVSLVVFLIMFALIIFGLAALPIIFFVGGTSILMSKLLGHYGVVNHSEIGLFISFTASAIAFSFLGNSIIKWFVVLIVEGGDEKAAEKWLKYTHKFFGQSQLRFFVYCIYFLLIVWFTILNLLGKLPTNTDQNFMFLTLQSFAAFVAFDTMIEKRKLIKPWIILAGFIKDGLMSIRDSPLGEIFKEEEKTKNK